MDTRHTQQPDDPPADCARLRAALERSAQALDAATLSRLNRARQAALAAARPSRPRWGKPLGWGLALTACTALGLAIAPLLQRPQAVPVSASDDFVLLTEDVDPALLEDLDFYAWLDSQAATDDAWEG